MKKLLKLTSLLLMALCGLVGCSSKEFNPESEIILKKKFKKEMKS